jgi:putative DNA primase/helicase
MSNDPFRPIGGAGAASKKGGEWTPLVPVPDDAPPPPARHPMLGQPTETYTYRAADGAVTRPQLAMRA